MAVNDSFCLSKWLLLLVVLLLLVRYFIVCSLRPPGVAASITSSDSVSVLVCADWAKLR